MERPLHDWCRSTGPVRWTGYPETRAALARAEGMGRFDERQLREAVAELDSIISEVDDIEVTAALAHEAGELAEAHGLRGDEAVHLAAAAAFHDGELVLATCDPDRAAAAISHTFRLTKPRQRTMFGPS